MTVVVVEEVVVGLVEVEEGVVVPVLAPELGPGLELALGLVLLKDDAMLGSYSYFSRWTVWVGESGRG
jgi:hypothetical protein